MIGLYRVEREAVKERLDQTGWVQDGLQISGFWELLKYAAQAQPDYPRILNPGKARSFCIGMHLCMGLLRNPILMISFGAWHGWKTGPKRTASELDQRNKTATFRRIIGVHSEHENPSSSHSLFCPIFVRILAILPFFLSTFRFRCYFVSFCSQP